MTFANTGFERYSRQTKRAVFLDEMNAIVQWKRLCALITPHYQTAKTADRRFRWSACCSSTFFKQWFNLSDPGVEEALYDMGDAPVPDETTESWGSQPSAIAACSPRTNVMNQVRNEYPHVF